MSSDIQLVEQEIYAVEQTFSQVLSTPSIQFAREAEFALQVISKNDYLLSVAKKNRQSLRDAVTNVAALGLSLNPAKKQAYLVPREGAVLLVPSYMGLIDLAVECGSIHWAKAEVVYERDSLQLQGFDKPPIHVRDPFAKERGQIVGAYCVAKLISGDYLTEVMSIDELHAIRNRSDAWKKREPGKRGPWESDPIPMYKKTVTRAASKYWPRRNGSDDRLAAAMSALDNDPDERIDFEAERGQTGNIKTTVDCDAFIREAQATTSEAALTAVYSRAMSAMKEARDEPGMERFKRAAFAHRDSLRAAAAGNVIDAEPVGNGE